jgi:hypothetical protein
MPIETFFFFGVKFDAAGDPLLGSGVCDASHKDCSSLSHLNLMMISVALMKNFLPTRNSVKKYLNWQNL